MSMVPGPWWPVILQCLSELWDSPESRTSKTTTYLTPESWLVLSELLLWFTSNESKRKMYFPIKENIVLYFLSLTVLSYMHLSLYIWIEYTAVTIFIIEKKWKYLSLRLILFQIIYYRQSQDSSWLILIFPRYKHSNFSTFWKR